MLEECKFQSFLWLDNTKFNCLATDSIQKYILWVHSLIFGTQFRSEFNVLVESRSWVQVLYLFKPKLFCHIKYLIFRPIHRTDFQSIWVPLLDYVSAHHIHLFGVAFDPIRALVLTSGCNPAQFQQVFGLKSSPV